MWILTWSPSDHPPNGHWTTVGSRSVAQVICRRVAGRCGGSRSTLGSERRWSSAGCNVSVAPAEPRRGCVFIEWQSIIMGKKICSVILEHHNLSSPRPRHHVLAIVVFCTFFLVLSQTSEYFPLLSTERSWIVFPESCWCWKNTGNVWRKQVCVLFCVSLVVFVTLWNLGTKVTITQREHSV